MLCQLEHCLRLPRVRFLTCTDATRRLSMVFAYFFLYLFVMLHHFVNSSAEKALPCLYTFGITRLSRQSPVLSPANTLTRQRTANIHGISTDTGNMRTVEITAAEPLDPLVCSVRKYRANTANASCISVSMYFYRVISLYK